MIKMKRKLFSVSTVAYLFTFFLCTACPAQETTGAISSVRISPDMRQIVIRAEGLLGKHSAFAFEKPYRLVVDFDSTSLAKISNKIKLEKPPINEIRLGKLENRARVVIDFGSYPVPAYAIERQDNMAVIALGETGPARPENLPEPAQDHEKRQPKKPTVNSKPTTPKKEPARTVESVPAPTPIRTSPPQQVQTSKAETQKPVHVIKKALLSNDLLLVEMQDPSNPANSCSLALEIDLKDQTIKGASLSSRDGEIKRFEISELNENIRESQDKANMTSGPVTGPRKARTSTTVFEAKPMEKPKNVFNTVPSVTSMSPPEGPDVQIPLKMEEFKLQVKKEH